MPLRILTWNINGIRAIKGKTIKQLLDSLQADVICLQETKVTRDMLDEPTAIVEGYDSYFSFSRKRTGYSGTANYCGTRALPLKAEEGLTGRLSAACEDIIKCYGNTEKYASDLDALDAEGRCVITLHQIRLPDVGIKEVALINVYVPRAGEKEERLQYKLKFLTLLQSRAEALLEQKIHVIIVGDLNLTHKKLDNCDPECDDDFRLRSSKVWMNELLQQSQRDTSLSKVDSRLSSIALPNLKGGMFSDSYRLLHPSQENAFTNWTSSTDARKTNYGRRLDYILVDTELAPYVSSCEIMANVEGSDHCPVGVTLNCDPVPSKACPQLSSKYMPEFKGQQQKLSYFFKSVKQDDHQCHSPGLLSSDSCKDLSQVTHCPAQKSAIITGSQMSRNAVNRKDSEKRSIPTAAIGQHKNTKKVKRHNNETVTKQVSLTSFFAKSDSAEHTSVQFVADTWASHSQVHFGASTEVDAGRPSSAPPNDSSSTSASRSEISAAENRPGSSVPTAAENRPGSSVPTAATFPSTDLSSVSPLVKDTSQAWKSLLTGPSPPPLCPGHKEPCILKTVNKKGPNKNKKFYLCARPEGAPGHPEHRCNYFVWHNNKK